MPGADEYSKMSTKIYRILGNALTGLVLLAGTAQACAAAPALDIRLEGNRVTLDVSDADLRMVLEDLASQGGFRYWISPKLESPPVNLQVQNDALETVLRRLLDDTSYALVMDKSSGQDRVSAVYVLPRGEAATSYSTQEPVPQSVETLQQALAAQSIPDNIRSAILDQAMATWPTSQESIEAQLQQGRTQLLEMIEIHGLANPETLQRLRESLFPEPAQAPADGQAPGE